MHTQTHTAYCQHLQKFYRRLIDRSAVMSGHASLKIALFVIRCTLPNICLKAQLTLNASSDPQFDFIWKQPVTSAAKTLCSAISPGLQLFAFWKNRSSIKPLKSPLTYYVGSSPPQGLPAEPTPKLRLEMAAVLGRWIHNGFSNNSCLIIRPADRTWSAPGTGGLLPATFSNYVS